MSPKRVTVIPAKAGNHNLLHQCPPTKHDIKNYFFTPFDFLIKSTNPIILVFKSKTSNTVKVLLSFLRVYKFAPSHTPYQALWATFLIWRYPNITNPLNEIITPWMKRTAWREVFRVWNTAGNRFKLCVWIACGTKFRH